MPKERQRQTNVYQIGFPTPIVTTPPRLGQDPEIAAQENTDTDKRNLGTPTIGVVPGLRQYERPPTPERRTELNQMRGGSRRHYAEDPKGVPRPLAQSSFDHPSEEAGGRTRRCWGLECQLRQEYQPPGSREADPTAPPRGPRGEHAMRGQQFAEALREAWQDSLDQWHERRPQRARSACPRPESKHDRLYTAHTAASRTQTPRGRHDPPTPRHGRLLDSSTQTDPGRDQSPSSRDQARARPQSARPCCPETSRGPGSRPVTPRAVTPGPHKFGPAFNPPQRQVPNRHSSGIKYDQFDPPRRANAQQSDDPEKLARKLLDEKAKRDSSASTHPPRGSSASSVASGYSAASVMSSAKGEKGEVRVPPRRKVEQ